MRVGQTGQIALVDDGGGEARLSEDHHPGSRLDQMRAGARADYQEKGILDLAMKPDDAGQAAENFALPAFAQYSVRIGGRGGAEFGRCAHFEYPSPWPDGAAESRGVSRAARSFSTNCVALMR
jgi:hypothetical protein